MNFSQTFSFKTSKAPLIILLLLWLLVQFSLYHYYGFRTDYEGGKYLYDADQLSQFKPVKSIRNFYAFHSLIIAFLLKLKLGLVSVFIFQAVLNLFASFRFYQSALILYRNHKLAFTVSAILILTFQVQMWNFYIYTESLFISVLVLIFYRLVVFDFFKARDYIWLAAYTIILSFIRPNGVLLLLPLSLFFLYGYSRYRFPLRYTIPLFVSFTLLLLAHFFGDASIMLAFASKAWKESWVIWEYAEISGDGFSPFASVIYTFFLRLIYFFGMIRPYFSDLHNLLIISFYPLYLLAIYGLKRFWKNNSLTALFVFSLVLTFSLFTLLTFVNWHGRFIAPLLPFFIIMAGFGLKRLFPREDYLLNKSAHSN